MGTTAVLILFGLGCWYIGFLLGQEYEVNKQQTKRPSIYSNAARRRAE